LQDSSTELVVHGTGEVVPLADAKRCALALSSIRKLENQLKDAKRQLIDAIVEETERQGTRTLDIGEGFKAVVSGGTDKIWDIEVLERLRDAGLPEERFNALVKTEVRFKVDAREAKRIAAANPVYAAIISDAETEVEAAYTVQVKR
jgi:hypothetical protein